MKKNKKPETIEELKNHLLYLYDHAPNRKDIALARIATEALIALKLISIED